MFTFETFSFCHSPSQITIGATLFTIFLIVQELSSLQKIKKKIQNICTNFLNVFCYHTLYVICRHRKLKNYFVLYCRLSFFSLSSVFLFVDLFVGNLLFCLSLPLFVKNFARADSLSLLIEELREAAKIKKKFFFSGLATKKK